jgi:hypothetical protein
MSVCGTPSPRTDIHGFITAPRRIVPGIQRATEHGLHAENLEVFGCDFLPGLELQFTAGRQILRFNPAGSKTPERSQVVGNGTEEQSGKILGGVLVLIRQHPSDPLRSGQWKRLQNQRIQETEHRGVHADAQRASQNDRAAEEWLFSYQKLQSPQDRLACGNVSPRNSTSPDMTCTHACGMGSAAISSWFADQVCRWIFLRPGG